MTKTVLYRITNKVNGKVYIGQTMQGVGRRWSEHKHRFNLGERDHKLYQSMRKHGWDNFLFEEICSALHADYLNELEVTLIKQYNCFERGYNMTCGGDSVSEETRQKISKAHKGRSAPWMVKSHATRKANNNYGFGFEVKDRCGNVHTGSNLKEFCKINQLDVSNLYHTKTHPKWTCKGFVLLRTFND